MMTLYSISNNLIKGSKLYLLPFIHLYIVILLLSPKVIISQKIEESDSITWSINIDDVVVTAQYAPTSSKKAIHRIKTINKEQISQRGVTTLEQLLSQELNIRISQDLVLGSSLSLQGTSGQNVQIMIDGIPVIGRLGDDIDLSQINLHNIERVEIVEGPLSVNYGTNALGGVINLITKKSQLNRFETHLESRVESIGRINLNSALGFRPLKNILLKVHGGYSQFDGASFRAVKVDSNKRDLLWNPKTQYYAGAMARYNMNDLLHFIYSFNWFDEKITNLGIIRRPKYKPYAFDDYYQTFRQDHSLHQEGQLSKNYFIKTTLGFNYFRRYKNTFRFNFNENEKIEESNQQDTTQFSAFIFRPVIASTFKDKKLNFQIGLDLHFESASGKRIKDINSKKPNYSELGDYAIFGSAQYNPNDRLAFQLGLRAMYNTKFKAPVVPSINLKYSINNEISIRSSYAKGFRAPSLKELYYYFVDANHFIQGNTDLVAETSDNFQISLDWKRQNDVFGIETSIAGFYNDIQQKIDLYEYVIVDGKIVPAVELGRTSTQYAYFNQSRYKTLGSNINFKYNYRNIGLNIGFSPIGQYNILSEDRDDVAPFTFIYESNGQISYRFPKYDLKIALFLRYNDKLIRYYLDYDTDGNPVTGQRTQDGFTLTDFTLSKYFFTRKLQFSGGINNIFDVQDIPFVGTGGNQAGSGSVPIGTGRNWFAKLTLNLGWD